MPVTRSEKRQRASSEQSALLSNNLAQTSEPGPSNSTSRPKKRSKELPPGSDVSPSNDNAVTADPKSDTGFNAPPEEPRRRSLRSCLTSSNKPDVAHAPEIKSGKTISRSEKRSEQRRLKKLQSRSDVSSSNNNTVASALKSDPSSFAPQEPRLKSLRSRSYVSSSNSFTPTPAPKLDMRSYNPQETGSKKIRLTSYESAASQIVLPDTLEEMNYGPRGEVGGRELFSGSSRPSTKKGNRSPSPAADISFTSPQEDSTRPKKKVRLFETTTDNDVQIPELPASDAAPRLKLHLKKLDSGPTLSVGNSASSSEVSTPFSEGLPAFTPFSQVTPAPGSEDLSSPLSESKSAPSFEGNPTSHSEDNVSRLSMSNSALLSKRNSSRLSEINSAPSSGPQSNKTAAAHQKPSTPKSKLKYATPKADSEDTMLTDDLSPEKQSKYRAEREKEPLRVAEQQKLLTTMDDFRKGFNGLLTHIRAPRKNSHNKKNPNEHMFALKLSPQLCLMAPSQRHMGIYMKDACFESTSEDMVTWVMGVVMEVVKSDGLAWGQVAVEMTEGGPLGKVSNWGFNQGCPHSLETCFINTNVEILLCRKTYSAVITYHHQWKCAGQYEVPSGDITDVIQEPRQVRTDHTTTGGGRSIQMGTGESGYGSGRYTPLAGPQFSPAAAAVWTPGGPHTVNGRPIAPSLADYLPANPYASPYSSPVHAPVPQIAFGDGIYDYLIDPALFTPPLHQQASAPLALPLLHQQESVPLAPAFDTPPQQPESDPFQPLYQWVQDDIPDYFNVWTAPPSPVQQFTYPDPDVATDDYVANWVGAKLNLPLEPERGAVSAAAPPLPAPMPVQPVVVAVPKKRVRKSRAKEKGVAAAAAASGAVPVPETPTTATPVAAMTMMETMTTIPAPAPDPVVLGPSPSPSETLAALQTAAAMSPSIPIPAAYRHVWFLNGRGRVSKTRDNNPRCRRCRKRHWACSRGQPCDECAKDGVACVYGPGVGLEEEGEKSR